MLITVRDLSRKKIQTVENYRVQLLFSDAIHKVVIIRGNTENGSPPTVYPCSEC